VVQSLERRSGGAGEVATKEVERRQDKRDSGRATEDPRKGRKRRLWKKNGCNCRSRAARLPISLIPAHFVPAGPQRTM
jgi:hypothetical protein